jgi:hypothetical protein
MSVGAYIVTLGAELAKKENGRSAAPYRGWFVPNNMWLWFYVVSTNVPPPCSMCFQAKNRGDEASDARNLGWSHDATGQNPEG